MYYSTTNLRHVEPLAKFQKFAGTHKGDKCYGRFVTDDKFGPLVRCSNPNGYALSKTKLGAK
ncbi:MAG: hypothetical protein ACPGJW_00675, partial [Paracoccaceae bacterium]